MTPEALLDLFVLSPVGLIEVDEDGRVEVANLAARTLLMPFITGPVLENLWAALAEPAPELSQRARSFDSSRGVVVERMELLAPHEARGITLSLVKTAPGRFVAMVADASELAGARRDAMRAAQQLAAVENAVEHHAIYTVDVDGRISGWSESAARLHQFGADRIIGQSLSALMPKGTSDSHVRDVLELAQQNGWCEEEGPRRRQDGTSFHAATTITALRDSHGEALGYSVVSHDLSEHRKLESVLRDDAASSTDYLTGVASQRSFHEIATLEVSRARRYGQPLSLLLVDPDNFRDLAETHGSTFADECLRAVATACRHESRNTDFVGRVGGESFAVLLPSTELSGGLVLAERIRERIQRHVFAGEFSGVRCTLSVGVAELSDTDPSPEGLLQQASTAVERAQAAGKNLVVGLD